MDNNQFQDREINCVGCRMPFVWEAGEQAFFATNGFSEPKRCKPCREKRKAEKGQQPSSGAQPAGTGYEGRNGSVTLTSHEGGGGGNGGGKRGNRGHGDEPGWKGRRAREIAGRYDD